MRFLSTETGEFVERNPEETEFAILSHTWGEYEQTYTELREIQTRYGLSGRRTQQAARSSQPVPSPSLGVASHSSGSSRTLLYGSLAHLK